jgi:hypothetical protein
VSRFHTGAKCFRAGLVGGKLLICISESKKVALGVRPTLNQEVEGSTLSALTILFNDLPTTKPARKHFVEVAKKPIMAHIGSKRTAHSAAHIADRNRPVGRLERNNEMFVELRLGFGFLVAVMGSPTAASSPAVLP